MLATGCSSSSAGGASSSVMTAEAAAIAALGKSPKKGILKKHAGASIEEQPQISPRVSSAGLEKSARWDEMNILQTYHPPDKDYGHMKIEEPKTPYNYVDATEDIGREAIDADEIKRRLGTDEALGHSRLHGSHVSLSSEDEPEDVEETPEQKVHRETFEIRRKAHYNEGHLLKEARKQAELELEQAELDNEDAGVGADVDPDIMMQCDSADNGQQGSDNSYQRPCGGKVTSSYQGPTGASS